MKRILYLLVLAIIIFNAVSCAVSPITGKREIRLFSDEQEIEMGKNADPDITWQFGGAYKDSQLTAYIDEVGQRVAKVSHRSEIPYHFKIVDNSIPNAFAVPGGYIYITRGLLTNMENEAQLAAVLGHEVAHVAARHSMKRLQENLGVAILATIIDQIASGSESYQKRRGLIKILSTASYAILSLGYSREDESEADKLGTIYTMKAGYNPEGMVQLLNVLASLHESEPLAAMEFFMSHPRTSVRIKDVNRQISELPPEQQKGLINAPQYKSKMSDLVDTQKAYDYYDKGEDLRKKGKYSEALTEYNEALKLRRNLAKPHHGIGLVYQAQGKYDEAVNEYKSAVRIDPEYVFAYNDMGKAYITMKRYNDAVTQLSKAIQLYENFDDAHANLGEAYYNLKQYADAVKSLEMAIELNQKHPRAHTTLGLTYEAMGDTQKAITAYENAVAVAPNESYTDTARQRLAQLEKSE